jgi:twitching motility protein PilT
MAAIDRVFDILLAQDASDLHLHQDQRPRLRLHGSIDEIRSAPVLDEKTIREWLMEICDPEKWKKFESTGDLDFAYSYADKARFRANYKKHVHGYGAVFRTIPTNILTLEDLQAPEALKKFATFANGLALVTGPTGSGKSTTLAAVIDYVNTNETRTILTIEEPIEFVHPQKKSTVIQREVGTNCRSFAAGLRGALRQDTEVVLVGEMRDLETISLAITAAETGLLVFGTLHTNSAIKTIDRIIDVFPAGEQNAVRETLANALRAVCAQLLIKRADSSGRVATHEILLQTRAISNKIREGNTKQIITDMMSGKQDGMQTMDDTIETYLRNNIISGVDAYMKALDKERFAVFAPMGMGK